MSLALQHYSENIMSEGWIVGIWVGSVVVLIIIAIIVAHVHCNGDTQCFEQAMRDLSNAIK